MGANFGYAQTVPASTSLPTPVRRAVLEDVRAHEQVRVPVAARVRAVRADAADLRREVEDELGPRVGEQALGVVRARQVVVGAARDEDVVAVVLRAARRDASRGSRRRP